MNEKFVQQQEESLKQTHEYQVHTEYRRAITRPQAGSLLGPHARAAEPRNRAAKPRKRFFVTSPLVREAPKESLLAGYAITVNLLLLEMFTYITDTSLDPERQKLMQTTSMENLESRENNAYCPKKRIDSCF